MGSILWVVIQVSRSIRRPSGQRRTRSSRRATKFAKGDSERGAERLTALAEALDKAADYYETQDEEDYRQLRSKEEGLN
ncbi:hypothetical protein AB0M83_05630 [Amycolatopsis sp. NPDC051106]|uniref:hypothetical protein n=1 Tax=unclassified Amycolatopsis TaxID=2618356 RepID=UPI00341420BE